MHLGTVNPHTHRTVQHSAVQCVQQLGCASAARDWWLAPTTAAVPCRGCRDGATIPALAAFQSALGIPTTKFGWGLGEGVHAPNERLSVAMYTKGSAAWAQLLYELGTGAGAGVHAEGGAGGKPAGGEGEARGEEGGSNGKAATGGAHDEL